MMFKCAYTSEFYRAFHDALHAEVESWTVPGARQFAPRDASRTRLTMETPGIAEQWMRVEQLERTCRNADATLLRVLAYSSAECG
jgi:hypothetical protein